ncbi:MAG: hypothetical protein QME42_02900 [bacterium]|nr:hypothetical protein [bacterium]
MKLSLGELYELAEDRPLTTSEIHKSNDYYGHATILKQYAKFPLQYQIKAVIEHGAFGGKYVEKSDIDSPLPAIFVFAPSRYVVFREKTDKALFSIGPMLNYVPHFLDAGALNLEKQKLGKNLLVFPLHSTHWRNVKFDVHSYCRYLEELGK